MNYTSEEFDPYQELLKEKSLALYCDNCQHYPLMPVHGHFMCSVCHMPTKCCEGIPAE